MTGACGSDVDSLVAAPANKKSRPDGKFDIRTRKQLAAGALSPALKIRRRAWHHGRTGKQVAAAGGRSPATGRPCARQQAQDRLAAHRIGLAQPAAEAQTSTATGAAKAGAATIVRQDARAG